MKKVDTILCKVFDLKDHELNDNLSMKDLSKWDSLTHMDLINSLESELNIQFTTDEIMNMNDVGKIKEITKTKMD